ncbi:Peptidoglycan glycosyltransferase MrdB [Polystyrenella longa]|uniref:Cell wall polymerase n=1 Tax=Polystyrenella longa TaxID=2528007 RepID=A0A518CHV8_9PLAN|nr:FtsW/RodA/SpoVE family cell cycle protein [Polystyrenella longa]QDU78820.1 Peptidoglycan glycosyltransferase MrdB [Polystyrenella longa]
MSVALSSGRTRTSLLSLWMHRASYTIVLCALCLMGLGLSGISRGDDLVGSGEIMQRQLIWIMLSVPVMFLTTTVSYRRLIPLSYLLFGVSLFLLVTVYFMPARNGSHRWIPLGVAYLQPSEFAKLTYIMALAHYLMYRRNYRRITGLLIPFALTFLPVALILKEPDLGTSLLFLPVLFSMLFAAGARPRHLLLIITLGIVSLPLLWLGMSAEQKSRVVTVFQQEDGGVMPRGDGYHLHHSKQMLALGGFSGSAVTGQTVEDPGAYYLPAGRTDFVFCLVGEQWGFLGCASIFALYIILFGCGLRIANATNEPFGRLLVVGIVALLATQTLINTGMTVGLMPITGMTLPLLSYGGSSLLSTCAALGLILNVGMRPGYEMNADPFRFNS